MNTRIIVIALLLVVLFTGLFKSFSMEKQPLEGLTPSQTVPMGPPQGQPPMGPPQTVPMGPPQGQPPMGPPQTVPMGPPMGPGQPPAPPTPNEINCNPNKWVKANVAVPLPNTNSWLLYDMKDLQMKKDKAQILNYANVSIGALPSCGPRPTFNALTENKITVLNALDAFLMTSQASAGYTPAQKNTLNTVLTKFKDMIANNPAIIL